MQTLADLRKPGKLDLESRARKCPDTSIEVERHRPTLISRRWLRDQLEERLVSSRCLVGDTPTEADWRLFPTCVRFDSVYYSHFKCNVRRIVDYPNLWAYTRDLYHLPRIAETVDMAQIKRHYYTTHDMINPSRIIPAGPKLDFLAPHKRG